jgi:hypothetical protein
LSLYVAARRLVDPYAPDQRPKPIGVFMHEFGIDCDLAPMALDRRKILHAWQGLDA